MLIIFNSDIIYHDRLIVEGISQRLQSFLSACADKNHVIVIPQTSLFEFTRKQSELISKNISEIERAFSLLDMFHIPYSKVDLSKEVILPDLVNLIKRQKVEVLVVEPTLEDFQGAHKKACLHENPHPIDTKSDEMRDLVIWMISLRLAREKGGALLISRDKIHNNPSGDDDAKKAGLIRVNSIEDAEWYLDVDVGTPATRLVEQLLLPVWNDLINQGLPLLDQASTLGISRASFVQGIAGPSSVMCTMKARTNDGKTLRALAEIHTNSMAIIEVNLSDIKIDGHTWQNGSLTIMPNKVWSYEKDDYGDRLDALMQVLEEQE